MKATAVRNANGSAVISPIKARTNDWEPLLAGISAGKTILEVGRSRNIFQQGDPAESVLYLRQGNVKLASTSEDGKEAIFAIVDAGDLLGEGCLAGQALRSATATALTDCTLVRVDKSVMANMLRQQPGASGALVSSLLHRSLRYEEDLVDQLLNTSERRLARSLLILAHVENDDKSEPARVLPKINQETLAQMVGTTRSRVSHFMNKFKQCGLVDYNSQGELMVHSKLFRVAGSWPSFAWTNAPE